MLFSNFYEMFYADTLVLETMENVLQHILSICWKCWKTGTIPTNEGVNHFYPPKYSNG